MIISSNFRTPTGEDLIVAAQQAAAAIPKIATPVAGDLLLQAADGTLTPAGVAPAAMLRAPADVATNAAKLALTGISAGHIVRITGEGNRLEMFTGTDPSSDDHWTPLTPHFRLGVDTILSSGTFGTEDYININGIDVKNGALLWITPGTVLNVVFGGLSINGVEKTYLGDTGAWEGVGDTPSQTFVVPIAVPARSTGFQMTIFVTGSVQ